MSRRNYAHRSGVIVDFCPVDGLWFDRDELRHVIEFIRTGGLRAAARADAQRAAADRELRENERRWLGGSPWPNQIDHPPRVESLIKLLSTSLRS